MALSLASRITMRVAMVSASLVAVGAGLFLGFTVAYAVNLPKMESFDRVDSAKPTTIYDIKGRPITEFFAEEKRDPVKIQDLPPHLIYALVTREDQEFFTHPGFSLKGIFRAAMGIVTGRNLGGGSTITQQLAGTLYADRRDKSVFRKLRELWYAIQLERQWTKQQIMEEYMNKMYFGHGTYGVEAASQFYFGHSAKTITVGEAAILVIQLSGSSGLYSPLRFPDRARERQRYILDNMVELGYVDAEVADASFKDYWDNYDVTRSADQTVYLSRRDAAPYFSEYIREELNTRWLLGDADINRDGYNVYTTLDLEQQDLAQKLMTGAIIESNKAYRKNLSGKGLIGADTWVPIVDLLSLTFNINEIRVADTKQIKDAKSWYRNVLNPVVDMMGLQFSTPDDKYMIEAAKASRVEAKTVLKRNTVEGALITIDNQTGYITAMVGGSRFEQGNQVNRAVQGKVQPGSTFKPLYYAAGIESGVITAATQFYDSPVSFPNYDGSEYTPRNYAGAWNGPVLVRSALNRSLNIPSIHVLAKVGFDDAISTSSRLLGIPQNELTKRGFVRKYPLALGIVSLSPLELARAFSAFPRQGKGIGQISIRYITDRDNKLVVEPEKEIVRELEAAGRYKQIISPATAYIMTDMLRTTITKGTLFYPVKKHGGLPMVMGAKTGTTDNWSSAWTAGFSPYYTTAIWFGFDEGAATNSLGPNQSGETLAAPVWVQFMKSIHQNLPPKDFPKAGGVVSVQVTERNGLLPPPDFKGKVITELFRSGTEPKDIDTDNEAKRIEEAGANVNLPINPLDLGDDLELDPNAQSLLDSILNNRPSTTQDESSQSGDDYEELLSGN